MKSRQTMRFLAVFLLLSLASAQPAKGEPRIINGDNAQNGRYPYTVSLQRPAFLGNDHFCGGSLIGKSGVV